jgi:hypothetical protein
LNSRKKNNLSASTKKTTTAPKLENSYNSTGTPLRFTTNNIKSTNNPYTYYNTLNTHIYQHFHTINKSNETPILETFAQHLHDHNITKTLPILPLLRALSNEQ